MKDSVKIVLALTIFLVAIFVFNELEYKPLNLGLNTYFQSSIFSATLVISIFKPALRIKLLYLGFLFIFLTTMLYLFQRLPLANSTASIGIGILLIVSLSYLPQLLRKGTIEDL